MLTCTRTEIDSVTVSGSSRLDPIVLDCDAWKLTPPPGPISKRHSVIQWDQSAADAVAAAWSWNTFT